MPPQVLESSPGLMHSKILLSPARAEQATPLPSPFPRQSICVRMPSHSMAYILPVRPKLACTSSTISRRLRACAHFASPVSHPSGGKIKPRCSLIGLHDHCRQIVSGRRRNDSIERFEAEQITIGVDLVIKTAIAIGIGRHDPARHGYTELPANALNARHAHCAIRPSVKGAVKSNYFLLPRITPCNTESRFCRIGTCAQKKSLVQVRRKRLYQAFRCSDAFRSGKRIAIHQSWGLALDGPHQSRMIVPHIRNEHAGQNRCSDSRLHRSPKPGLHDPIQPAPDQQRKGVRKFGKVPARLLISVQGLRVSVMFPFF